MHNHRCVVCGLTWDCTDPTWGKRSFSKCGVTYAAKVNGDGPYCTPCREVEMKRRVAFIEAWNLRAEPRVWKPYADAARAHTKE